MKNLIFVVLFSVLGTAIFAGGSAESIGASVSFSGIERLTVEGAFFDVDIAGASTAIVEAEFVVPARLREQGVRVRHDTRGSELRVWVERPAFSITSFPWSEARMRFTVPAATSVKVNNSSGSVTVERIESPELNLEVSSGSLQVRNCSAELRASSSSGNITIESSTGGKMLKASSGNITLLDSKGDVEASSSSGKQRYEGIEGSIVAQSSSGDISVRDAVGTLDLEASSGRLSGSGVTITGDSSFETSSGSIEFDFTNADGEFTFELRSTSGTISAGRTRAKGTVQTGSGQILIKGKSSSGSQSYK